MNKKRLITSIALALVLLCAAAFISFGEMNIQTSSKINSDGSYTMIVNATQDEGEVFYQWYRCNSSGSTISTVSGANDSVLRANPDEENTYYLCRISYLTEEGEQSLDSSVFTVEAKPEEKKVEIMTFAVDGIDKPITGMTPDTTAIATGSAAAGYSIVSVEWEPRTSTFQPETGYTVTVTIKISEGYEAGKGYKCMVNGENAVSNGNTTGETIEFYYTFPDTEAAEQSDMINEEEEEASTPLGIPALVWVLIILAIIAIIVVLIVKSIKSKKAAAAAYKKRGRCDDEDVYSAKIREAEEAEQDLNELKRIRALDRENMMKNNRSAVYGAEMTEQDAVHRRKIRETVEEPMDESGTNNQPETSGFRAAGYSSQNDERITGSRVQATKETIIMSKDAMAKQATSDTINMQKSDIQKETKGGSRKSKPAGNAEDIINDNDISYFDDSEIDNKYF